MEKLTGEHLAVPEVTLSEEGQRSKLRVVLAFANKVVYQFDMTNQIDLYDIQKQLKSVEF